MPNHEHTTKKVPDELVALANRLRDHAEHVQQITLAQLRSDLVAAARAVEDRAQERDNSSLAALWASLSRETLAAIVGELTLAIDAGNGDLTPYADQAAAALDARA